MDIGHEKFVSIHWIIILFNRGVCKLVENFIIESEQNHVNDKKEPCSAMPVYLGSELTMRNGSKGNQAHQWLVGLWNYLYFQSAPSTELFSLLCSLWCDPLIRFIRVLLQIHYLAETGNTPLLLYTSSLFLRNRSWITDLGYLPKFWKK